MLILVGVWIQLITPNDAAFRFRTQITNFDLKNPGQKSYAIDLISIRLWRGLCNSPRTLGKKFMGRV